MNIQLPPWARQIQQSKWFQLGVMPVVIAFVTGVYNCAGVDLAKLSFDCLYDGLRAGRAAIGLIIGVYVVSAWQNKPGSAEFNPDGTLNKQVQEVVAADQANKPVAVVPVPTPQARDEIRVEVDRGKPIAIVAAPQSVLDNAVNNIAKSSVGVVATVATK